MRRLRIVISSARGAASTLAATVLGPAIGACGLSPQLGTGDASSAMPVDASDDQAQDGAAQGDGPSFHLGTDGGGADAQAWGACPSGTCAHTVQLAEAGTFPDLASLCAAAPPVVSGDAVTVALAGYDAAAATSNGLIAVQPGLLAALVGDPLVAFSPAVLTAGPLAPTSSGYAFTARGAVQPGQQVQVTVTLHLACGGDSGVDAGLQTVASTAVLDLCVAPATPDAAPQGPLAWRSSGESCLLCCPIVAEMAPTPILADGRGDDLPLAHALRLRVAGLAHAGRQVLLCAQNDAGPDAGYEWRVSGGTLERITDDIVVWTLPDASDASPFGQVAVWNDAGAAVENFYWSAA
jgi:hypothetical protein